jgi:hypothetical protein
MTAGSISESRVAAIDLDLFADASGKFAKAA